VEALAIGASEIAQVLGISPFGDACQVWNRKKGLIQVEQTEPMFWGTMLEPVVAKVFGMKMGMEVEWFNRRIYSDLRAWQYSSPDAFIQGEPRMLLECKTAGLHMASEWDREAENEDGIPEYYWVQVEWQMSTTQLKTAYVAVLIGGNDFRVYRIEHNPELEEWLLEEGYDFFRKYLLADVEPPIGASRRSRDFLRQRFPRPKTKSRPATPEEMALVGEYAVLRAELKEREIRREELENRLQLAIGDAEGLKWGQGELTWRKTRDREETDWQKLARQLLLALSEKDAAQSIAEYTHVVEGYRRMLLKGKAA